ncbi:MAG: hypothetical protein J5642_02630 [Bacteroidales bacterium]|nr:hypothetical protein [Bacteroidales bacterium]
MKKIITDNMYILVIASIALSVYIIFKMKQCGKNEPKTKNIVIANAEPETEPAEGEGASN